MRGLASDAGDSDFCNADFCNVDFCNVDFCNASISGIGIKLTVLPSATACNLVGVRSSGLVTATIRPCPSTIMVVGYPLTPYEAETLPVVSTPTHPGIFLLVRNFCTTFSSSLGRPSTEMN